MEKRPTRQVPAEAVVIYPTDSEGDLDLVTVEWGKKKHEQIAFDRLSSALRLVEKRAKPFLPSEDAGNAPSE